MQTGPHDSQSRTAGLYARRVEPVQTLAARYYTDSAVFAIERNTIFAPAWNLVAYEHQLLNAGDYVTENLAGWPIFVQRAPDGTLRGFHNVCPHRAGPIVWDGEGCQANLVCRYHGWAFRGDGSLLKARDFGGEVEGNPSLTPIRVASWRGMVFVCLDRDTADLHEWLGDFPAECEDYPIETYRFHSKSVRSLAANWKTYADNFNEGYHLPMIHTETLARAVDPLAYRVRVGANDARWNIHTAPPRDGTEWTGVWGYFWPSFSFNIFAGGMAIERWLPRGHDHSDLIFEYFFADDATGIEALVKESEEVADEDVLACEHVQRNLASGMYHSGQLSPRHEAAIQLFADLVRDAVDPYLV
jgi:choline monooxygenase